MTQRERHIPDGGADDHRPAHVGEAPPPSSAADTATQAAALVWEDLHRSGPTAGPSCPDAASRPAADPRRSLLAGLLHGKAQDLTPFRPPPPDDLEAAGL